MENISRQQVQPGTLSCPECGFELDLSPPHKLAIEQPKGGDPMTESAVATPPAQVTDEEALAALRDDVNALLQQGQRAKQVVLDKVREASVEDARALSIDDIAREMFLPATVVQIAIHEVVSSGSATDTQDSES
jgi:hypothetical protein